MAEHHDRQAGEGFPQRLVDDAGIVNDMLPATLVREVPGVRAAGSVAAVVVSTERETACRGGFGEPCVAAGVLAEPVQHLDDGRGLALRVPREHPDLVPCRGLEPVFLRLHAQTSRPAVWQARSDPLYWQARRPLSA